MAALTVFGLLATVWIGSAIFTYLKSRDVPPLRPVFVFTSVLVGLMLLGDLHSRRDLRTQKRENTSVLVHFGSIDKGTIFDVPIGFRLTEIKGGEAVDDSQEASVSRIPAPDSAKDFEHLWAIARRDDGLVRVLRAGAWPNSPSATRALSMDYASQLRDVYLERGCMELPINDDEETQLLVLKCGDFSLLVGESPVDAMTGKNVMFVQVRQESPPATRKEVGLFDHLIPEKPTGQLGNRDASKPVPTKSDYDAIPESTLADFAERNKALLNGVSRERIQALITSIDQERDGQGLRRLTSEEILEEVRARLERLQVTPASTEVPPGTRYRPECERQYDDARNKLSDDIPVGEYVQLLTKLEAERQRCIDR
jgi:hypothetical protein